MKILGSFLCLIFLFCISCQSTSTEVEETSPYIGDWLLISMVDTVSDFSNSYSYAEDNALEVIRVQEDSVYTLIADTSLHQNYVVQNAYAIDQTSDFFPLWIDTIINDKMYLKHTTVYQDLEFGNKEKVYVRTNVADITWHDTLAITIDTMLYGTWYRADGMLGVILDFYGITSHGDNTHYNSVNESKHIISFNSDGFKLFTRYVDRVDTQIISASEGYSDLKKYWYENDTVYYHSIFYDVPYTNHDFQMGKENYKYTRYLGEIPPASWLDSIGS